LSYSANKQTIKWTDHVKEHLFSYKVDHRLRSRIVQILTLLNSHIFIAFTFCLLY